MMDKGKEEGILGQGSICWHKIQTEGVLGRQKSGLLEDNVRNKQTILPASRPHGMKGITEENTTAWEDFQSGGSSEDIRGCDKRMHRRSQGVKGAFSWLTGVPVDPVREALEWERFKNNLGWYRWTYLQSRNRHRCSEQIYGYPKGKSGWQGLGDRNWHIYTTSMCETDN